MSKTQRYLRKTHPPRVSPILYFAAGVGIFVIVLSTIILNSSSVPLEDRFELLLTEAYTAKLNGDLPIAQTKGEKALSLVRDLDRREYGPQFRRAKALLKELNSEQERNQK